MRRVAIAWALGAAGLWGVGALARWIPPGWIPDPGLLTALGLALHVGGAPGLVGAWAIGWATDVLSGGLLGQYAFLDLAVWALARAAQGRVDLERPLVLGPFVLALALLQAAGLWALGGIPRPGRETLAILIPYAFVNMAAAIALRPIWSVLLDRPEVGEPVRGAIRLDAGAGLR